MRVVIPPTDIDDRDKGSEKDRISVRNAKIARKMGGFGLI
jgi:hypothetical protein